jgi:Ca2+/H+ antiporter, TMEM165/GDT1 family
MRGRWFLRGLKFVLFALLFVALASFVVMRLWNWLTPALFGWHLITFWQAVGILILSKILIGGFRGHGSWKSCGSRRMMARWENMTPDERAKFREGMRGRCGPYGRASSETKA